jgi:hypothetical protein
LTSATTREVAHRREEHRDARFARPHVGRFLGHLGHPHGVAVGIETIEGRGVQIELVAEYQNQVAQRSHGAPCCVGRLQSNT